MAGAGHQTRDKIQEQSEAHQSYKSDAALAVISAKASPCLAPGSSETPSTNYVNAVQEREIH